jgi:hypothetical protein
MPCRHTQPYTGDVHPDDELDDNEAAEQCARCSRWFRLFTERDDNYPWHNAGYCSTLCRELDNPEER